MQAVQVLSPDGFTIDFNAEFYLNMEQAIAAFEKWKLRYEKQGYYSSNFERIPLDELKDHCTFAEYPVYELNSVGTYITETGMTYPILANGQPSFDEGSEMSLSDIQDSRGAMDWYEELSEEDRKVVDRIVGKPAEEKKPLTFSQFQASRSRYTRADIIAKNCGNATALAYEYLIENEEPARTDVVAMLIYDKGCYIVEYDNRYWVIIGNADYASFNLVDCEVHLYKDHYLKA